VHIVIHEYDDGHRYVFETDDRGENVRDLEGQRRPGKRIRAVLDMLCDNNKAGKETLLAAVKHGEELLAARSG
jgi:hypothetical protein